MTDEYNPNATDGDGDGMVQDGTPFERPVGEELEVIEELVAEETVEAPAEEVSTTNDENVIASAEDESDVPALTPTDSGAIGSGTVKKAKKAAPKKAAVTEKAATVALMSNRNLVWNGVGKLKKGYNIVPAEGAEKWLTLNGVTEVTPEEVKAQLG